MGFSLAVFLWLNYGLQSLIDTNKLSGEFIIDAIHEKIKRELINQQDPSMRVIGLGQRIMISQILFVAESLKLHQHLSDTPKSAHNNSHK